MIPTNELVEKAETKSTSLPSAHLLPVPEALKKLLNEENAIEYPTPGQLKKKCYCKVCLECQKFSRFPYFSEKYLCYDPDY